MKTHILLTLLALVISACASKEHQSQADFERLQDKQTEFVQYERDPSVRFR